jgi:hypothetical protein
MPVTKNNRGGGFFTAVAMGESERKEAGNCEHSARALFRAACLTVANTSEGGVARPVEVGRVAKAGSRGRIRGPPTGHFLRAVAVCGGDGFLVHTSDWAGMFERQRRRCCRARAQPMGGRGDSCEPLIRLWSPNAFFERQIFFINLFWAT